jgi:multidrug efflux system membrane fusion protein
MPEPSRQEPSRAVVTVTSNMTRSKPLFQSLRFRSARASTSLLIAVAAMAPCMAARAQPAPAPPAPPGVPVQVTTTKRADVPVTLRNIASVQAFQAVLIRARVDGTLDRVMFAEGQDVKAGDVIAQIDPRPYAATLAQAAAKKAADEASLANAQRDLARYSSLANSSFASRQQVDTQNAMVAQLQANIKGDDATIDAARLNLQFTSITSPIDGRTGLRLVDPGNLIHATDTTGIVTITQIHPISVIFTLPQDTLPQIQTAMGKGKLPVLSYTADDKTMLGAGELLTTDNTIDQSTGTIRLKAVFQNQESRLWPGQFINVRLTLGTLRNALTVPSVAVQRGPSGLFVYVVKPDGTAAVQPVDVTQDDGQVAVIGKGLDDDVQVVTSGQSRLQNGTRVAATQMAPKS